MSDFTAYLLRTGWKADPKAAEIGGAIEAYWLPFGYLDDDGDRERVVLFAQHYQARHPSTGHVFDSWELEVRTDLGEMCTSNLGFFGLTEYRLRGSLTTLMSKLAQLLSVLHGDNWVHP